MKKHLLICMSLLMVIGITACGKENNADNNEISEVTFESLNELGDDANDEYQDSLPAEEDDGLDAPDVVTDEQALDAVKNFISSSQPEAVIDLSEGEYTEYFTVESSTPEEIVVLYRSYTASQTRFYVERATGDTRVTELVPGIIDEETETGETFNIKYFMGDGDVGVAAYSDDFLINYTWKTSSMVADKYGNVVPEYDVRFSEKTIDYGHMDGDTFLPDHSDTITLLEQYSEHSFKIQAVSANGTEYTYQTSASDENILEYYETWDEAEYPDTYSGGASLFK